MKIAVANAIHRLRQLDPQLAANVRPATLDGLAWDETDWELRAIKRSLGWIVWKERGAHQLGLFGERRGPKGGIPWKRKRLPWLRVVFLNGARCASEPHRAPGRAGRTDLDIEAT